MKLAKNEPVKKPEFNKKYLIPSILAVGIIPLIMHQHVYRTHLETEDFFAIGNYRATDFFLFYKQWAVIILALVCLLILLVRAKYYYEDLPWDKKAFIPLVIYGVFVFLSACFAKKPLFAFAGGYDMFQSALAILSYGVLFYYTYSCMKSEECALYFLRGSEYLMTIEITICFCQAIGHDPFATKVGKLLITSPSMWQNVDSLNMEASVYGTMYNVDFLAMYLPIVICLFLALLVVEKKIWRRIYNAALLAASLFLLTKVSSSASIAVVGAIVIAFLILCFRKWTSAVVGIALIVVIGLGGIFIVNRNEDLKNHLKAEWSNAYTLEDDSVPFQEITTGNKDEGVTVELKDGVKFTFFFDIERADTDTTETAADAAASDAAAQQSAYQVNDFKVVDANGNELGMTLTDETNQTYVFNDAPYANENLYFYRDSAHGLPAFFLAGSGTAPLPFINHYFDADAIYGFAAPNETVDQDGYYLLSTAGRTVKLPQKNEGEVYEIFSNGMLSGRGSIYNRSLPLLKHHIFLGAGADNYIMVYPQRDYILDYYLNYGNNSINVKPHCYYLQLWIQEGFIAFAAAMIFLFWYLIRSVRLYRKVGRKDKTGILGFAIFTGILGCMIAFLVNDSNICTGPVFWTMLGAGWGINELYKRQKSMAKDQTADKAK